MATSWNRDAAVDSLLNFVFDKEGNLRPPESGGSWPPVPVGHYVSSTGAEVRVVNSEATTKSVGAAISDLLDDRAEMLFNLMVGQFHDSDNGPVQYSRTGDTLRAILPEDEDNSEFVAEICDVQPPLGIWVSPEGDVVIDANFVTSDWSLALAVGLKELQEQIWVQTSRESGQYIVLGEPNRQALAGDSAKYLQDWADQIRPR